MNLGKVNSNSTLVNGITKKEGKVIKNLGENPKICKLYGLQTME